MKTAIRNRLAAILAAGTLALKLGTAQASIAYGDINNFDTVNDTGVPCHGFEIELDDVHSTDITYTYDWNHYGAPRITEDNSNPLHPKVFVRYASARNPDGTWAAYTAIPGVPLSPTDGHMCTNPGINAGCEHFGVGYYGSPSAIKYNWLVDDGTGNLIHGPAVNIATPTFVFYPPVGGAPPQVQAAIVPPPPPVAPALEFGPANWVKEIRTTTHNNGHVDIKDLVSDDPNDPADNNWQNGEPDEVEVEWQILQTEFNAGNGGANGELQGAPEDLPNGDEVVTRRYEFFKYVGPLDAETGEILCDNVAADGIHGVGIKIIDGVTYDFSTIVIVGDYIGAQMAAFDAAAPLGLIDHLQDGDLDQPYVDRTVVIGGNSPYLATITSGSLPNGMTFDQVLGVLSGTPTESGVFPITIDAVDADNVTVTRTYSLNILAPAVAPPPTITCPADITVNTDPGQCSAVVNYPAPITTGDSVTVVCNPPSGSSFPVGTTIVNCTATDAANLIVTCSFNVSVADNQPPDITLTGSNPLTVECHTAFVDPGATAQDNCAGAVAVASSGSVDANTVGSYTITYSATDPSGNSGTATRTVNVTDTQAPIITLTGVNPLIVSCHTPFTDPGATATDACAGGVAVTVSGTVDVNTTGDYVLTYSAADPSGNSTSATRTVSVICADVPLTITCPSDISAPNDPGQCSAVVNYPTPIATGDNVTVVCNPPSGSSFPIGTNVIACTATDASGLTATCNFKVIVQDAQPPAISCPADITVATAVGASTVVVTFSVNAPDNCPGVSVVCQPPSDSAFPIGTTTVTCVATDAAGNVSECSFTVTVTGSAALTISCPPDVSIGNDPRQCSAVVNYVVTANDPNATIVCTPPSGSAFPLGTTLVNCTATDAGGNSVACSFSVTVSDSEAPSTSYIAVKAFQTYQNPLRRVGSFKLSAADNCDPDPLIYISDSVTGFVAGPFHNGDQVEIGKGPTLPNSQHAPAGGPNKAVILLEGGARMYSVDSAGNISSITKVL